jgi:hypothetical protein
VSSLFYNISTRIILFENEMGYIEDVCCEGQAQWLTPVITATQRRIMV